MIYKPLHTLRPSYLGMGNMRLPVTGGSFDAPIDRIRAQEIIDAAIASGINYYDTAYVYHNGESETFLGEALARYPRESYYLATKYILFASPDYRAVFQEQCARLKTEHIDFYLIHAVFDNNYRQYLDCGCIEYFLEQKEKGRIRYLGFSFHADIDTLVIFADHHQWDFAQIQLNAFDWIFGQAKQEHAILRERGIPLIAMEPVRGGVLASLSPRARALLQAARPDWSMASWALRWVKRLPGVQVILSGMSTLGQLTENAALFSHDESMGGEEEKILFKACELFREEVRIPCTACRYCCDGCPAHIDIPQVIGICNRYKTDGDWALEGFKAIQSGGKPDACTECGACNAHCPQGIEVTAIMSEMAACLRKRMNP